MNYVEKRTLVTIGDHAPFTKVELGHFTVGRPRWSLEFGMKGTIISIP